MDSAYIDDRSPTSERKSLKSVDFSLSLSGRRGSSALYTGMATPAAFSHSNVFSYLSAFASLSISLRMNLLFTLFSSPGSASKTLVILSFLSRLSYFTISSLYRFIIFSCSLTASAIFLSSRYFATTPGIPPITRYSLKSLSIASWMNSSTCVLFSNALFSIAIISS